MRAHIIGKTLVAAAVGAASLTACGSLHADSPQSTRVTAETTANSATAGTASDRTEAASGANLSTEDTTGDSARELGPCSVQQVESEFVLATTGRVAGHVTITNNSGEPCQLDNARPAIEFTGRDGTPIEDVSYLPGRPGTTPITLAPGDSAAAELDWQDMGDQCVARVWAMDMALRPGEAPKSLDPLANDKPWVFDLCGHEVTVHGWREA
ncbi:DUF4232 domain-containing protein [Saccharopolyspora sp. NPDC000359]|uniref:DUF4232 domain-containing protein n=1 Tax=Saccharopolyspora sp. NPDC000359 TaxID=3154251 RepID=UPI0033199418